MTTRPLGFRPDSHARRRPGRMLATGVTVLVATVVVGCAASSPEPVVEGTSGADTPTATPTDGLVVPSPRPPTPPTPAPSDPGPDDIASPRGGPAPTTPAAPSTDDQVPDAGGADDEETDMAVGRVPDRVLDAVVAAASDHADVAPADVVTVSAERVTFRDGSLDCPRPGRQYTQALVEGYRVVVEAGGDRLDYRMALDGPPQLCIGGGTPLPPSDV